MKTLQLSWIVRRFILVCMVMIMFSWVGPSNSVCEFDAIFNFGDSNVDTGGYNAAFPAQASPFGMTYFKKPVGRASDGRLIVDFLGIVYLYFGQMTFAKSMFGSEVESLISRSYNWITVL